MGSTNVLTLCLGILDPIPVEIPADPPKTVYRRGNFEVREWDTCSELRCLCGRSSAIPVHLNDLKKASALHGLEACDICVQEFKNSKSRSQLVEAWIRRNRFGLDNSAHLYLPENLKRFVSEGQVMRPKRCVYQAYHGVDLQSEDHVLSTCGDPACLNPLHMMLGKSPAKKITPQMEKDITAWLEKNIKTKAIVELVSHKYKKRISLRTIQLIQKQWRQSASTMSYCGC
jgi:hypothetical protein